MMAELLAARNSSSRTTASTSNFRGGANGGAVIPVKYEFVAVPGLRRCTLAVPPRLYQLRRKLAQSFPAHAVLFDPDVVHLGPGRPTLLRIVYRDDEGDEVVITTDHELEAAVRAAHCAGKVFRFTVPAAATVRMPTQVPPVPSQRSGEPWTQLWDFTGAVDPAATGRHGEPWTRIWDGATIPEAATAAAVAAAAADPRWARLRDALNDALAPCAAGGGGVPPSTAGAGTPAPPPPPPPCNASFAPPFPIACRPGSPAPSSNTGNSSGRRARRNACRNDREHLLADIRRGRRLRPAARRARLPRRPTLPPQPTLMQLVQAIIRRRQAVMDPTAARRRHHEQLLAEVEKRHDREAGGADEGERATLRRALRREHRRVQAQCDQDERRQSRLQRRRAQRQRELQRRARLRQLQEVELARLRRRWQAGCQRQLRHILGVMAAAKNNEPRGFGSLGNGAAPDSCTVFALEVHMGALRMRARRSRRARELLALHGLEDVLLQRPLAGQIQQRPPPRPLGNAATASLAEAAPDVAADVPPLPGRVRTGGPAAAVAMRGKLYGLDDDLAVYYDAACADQLRDEEAARAERERGVALAERERRERQQRLARERATEMLFGEIDDESECGGAGAERTAAAPLFADSDDDLFGCSGNQHQATAPTAPKPQQQRKKEIKSRRKTKTKKEAKAQQQQPAPRKTCSLFGSSSSDDDSDADWDSSDALEP